jgi:FkbM family methyltransferase
MSESTPRVWLNTALSVSRRGAFKVLDLVGVVPWRTTTYLGHRFRYPVESLIGRQIAAGGEWDANLAEIAEAVLPMEAPVICEVGSNIGASLLQLKRVRPQAQILAFEPSDRFRPFLEKNIALAGLTDVTVFTALLGAGLGTVSLYNNVASASAARPRDPDQLVPRREQTVAVTTLDATLPRGVSVDLIKVDTDGFDFEVLRGAQATIERDSPVIYVEYYPNLLDRPEEDLAWLQSIGYETFFCFDPSGTFSSTTADIAKVTRRARLFDYYDILVCPRGSALEAPLATRYH